MKPAPPCRALIAALGLLAATPRSAAGAEWTEAAVPPERRLPGETNALWYRCHLQAPDRLVNPEGTERDLWRSSMVLAVADLPGPFEIHLNGTRIVRSDGVPLGEERRFKVPRGILEKDVFNALAFRLEGEAARRGLTVGPVYLDYFHELILDRPWSVTSGDPAPDELAATSDQPERAVYRPGEFRLSSRALAPTREPVPGRRVPPAEALELLETDDDLAVDALLSEPEVAQPTHLSFDGRGRMWIAQYRQYPYPAGLKMIGRDQYYRSKYDRVPPPPPGHDRGADIISVHEDADGDGIYESSRKVIEGLNMANAALRGWGGIWVMHTPYLLFYPDIDGDDKPDGPPEVRLAGFGLEDTHSVANGLAWGPDGWLYGGQGSTTVARVTRPDVDPPGSPENYNEGCHIWRYHPRTRDFELFADGGGNIFGLFFDAEGRLFTGHNGGDTRGWHHVQGGLYLKQGRNPGKFGPPPNPFGFGEMPMMRSANPVPRFSHMTITGGGSALPARLRGRFLSIDPIHHRVVAARRAREGSTFHTADLGFPLRSTDLTFRPVYLANSPCGGVVIADFREEYIAHGQNYQGQIDPTSGRIYRLRSAQLPLIEDRNLEAKSSGELVALLGHDNLWHRQTAARLLGQRADPESVAPLLAALKRPGAHPALEALWALHQMDRLDDETARLALGHDAPMVRAWAIRLVGDKRRIPDDLRSEVEALARAEPDSEVRCQILSTIRRLPVDQGVALIEALRLLPEDAQDPFIAPMTWFAIEAWCADHRERVLRAFEADEMWRRPVIGDYVIPRLMRRFAEAGSRGDLMTCARLLDLAPDEAARAALVGGFEQAFEGRPLPELPTALGDRLGKTSLSTRIRSGEPSAIDEGLALLADAEAKPAARIAAARAFGAIAPPAAQRPLLELCIGGAGAPLELRRAAITALQRYTAAEIGDRLTKAYADLPAELQPAARGLLAARPAWAKLLLEAVAAGGIPGEHIDRNTRSRLSLHGDTRIAALLAEHFPDPEAAPVAVRAETVRAIIVSRSGDPYRGEPIYMARCASCHRLFFKGGHIGPDLTQYQRDDLPTLLASILEPSAEIREGYENVAIRTTDGRALSGFLADEDANTVVVRGFDGSDISVDRKAIESMKPSGSSLMPAGLIDGLSDAELADLFAYLRISQPISR